MTRREPRRGQSSRPGRPSEERSLDALLEGRPLPDGGPARWQPVSQVLTALTSVPASSELSGEARALAEFRVRPLHGAEPGQAGRRTRVTWPRGVGWLRGAGWPRGPRPAVAAAGGAVLIGGFLAVAYAGDLPAAAQRLAHNTIDAPGAGRDRSPGPVPDRSSRLATSAGQASPGSAHGSPRPDRRSLRGSTSGSWRHHRLSGFPSGAPGGWPSGHEGQGSEGQGSGSPGLGSPDPSGRPSDSPTPAPTQQPSPSGSLAPPAGATPSPSATASAIRRSRHHLPDPGGTSSSPP